MLVTIWGDSTFLRIFFIINACGPPFVMSRFRISGILVTLPPENINTPAHVSSVYHKPPLSSLRASSFSNLLTIFCHDLHSCLGVLQKILSEYFPNLSSTSIAFKFNLSAIADADDKLYYVVFLIIKFY